MSVLLIRFIHRTIRILQTTINIPKLNKTTVITQHQLRSNIQIATMLSIGTNTWQNEQIHLIWCQSWIQSPESEKKKKKNPNGTTLKLDTSIHCIVFINTNRPLVIRIVQQCNGSGMAVQYIWIDQNHSIRISNKCVICLPRPETVCKWHHQLSVWHYLDIRFGLWVFINGWNHLAGICANVQELFQLQLNAVQLFIQPIVDSNCLWMLHFNWIHHLLHCSFSCCWWNSILCNKNCPLNKQNLQFKWLG